MHILIVEDLPRFSDPWKRVLEYRKCTVSVAQTYSEAIQQFTHKQPDAIICDNDLKDCAMRPDAFDAGYFFIKHVRAEGFRGRILLYTGNPRRYFQGELSLEGLNVSHSQKRGSRILKQPPLI